MKDFMRANVGFLESFKSGSLQDLFPSKTLHTLKKARVEPDSKQPYLILVCLARSSADSIGASILSTVRKAARLAV